MIALLIATQALDLTLTLGLAALFGSSSVEANPVMRSLWQALGPLAVIAAKVSIVAALIGLLRWVDSVWLTRGVAIASTLLIGGQMLVLGASLWAL